MKKTLFFALITIISTVSAVSCRHGATPYRTMDGAVWRTTYHMTYASHRSLDDSILAVINAVDASLSAFNRLSLVAALNRGDTTVVADRHLREVFETSYRVWEASGGRFDPTVGPAVSLWGFGPQSESAETAECTAHEVDSVRALVGLGECSVGRDGRLTKKHPATQFNFSAIAKGYACDEVAAMLRRNGVDDYLVEIGGEIALGGMNNRGEPWRVMVEAPSLTDTSAPEAMTFICPGQGGVATSGNYRNYKLVDDTLRLGHTILPSTCRPAPQRLLSATVTAPTCMLADALATACMTGDTAQARRLIERFDGVACMVVTPDSTVAVYGDFPLRLNKK